MISSFPRSNEGLASRYEKLTERLALVCKENSALTNKIASLEQEKEDLTKVPFNKDSVLGQLLVSLEKGAWAASAKNSPKEQLQKLCSGLQKEYVEYKTAHTHSDEEFESLTKQLQSSQNKSAELSSVLRDLACNSSGANEIGKTNKNEVYEKEINDLKAEVERLQELKSSPSAGLALDSEASASELRVEKEEVVALKQQLVAVKKALTTEEGLHKMKAEESAALAHRLETIRVEHKEEILALKTKYRTDGKESLEDAGIAGSTEKCPTPQEELATLKARLADAQVELTRTRSQVGQSVSAVEKKCAAVESKLVETQAELSEKNHQLSHSVPQSSFDTVFDERQKLIHEVSLMKERISYLEKASNRTNDAAGTEGSMELDDEEILAALERYKEKISSLEFEKEQLTSKLQGVEKLAQELETKRSEELRATEADRQRIAFLIKKSTSLTSEIRELKTEKESLSAALVTNQAELQRAQRQVETTSELQKKLDERTEVNRQLEERLSGAKEMEERLVKAKETIAYMELSQSRSISLAQYAELQTEKQKLEHSLTPVQTQLEDAKKENDRLKAELQKCASVADTEKDRQAMESLKDEIDGLRENEKIVMEKLSHYKDENQRLTSLNVALDEQMSNMQQGIKEMATHMEKVRSEAKEAAEKAAEKEVVRLREELEHAKSTIAGVQATEGQFVAEGLYLSAVEEKQELLNQMQQKSLELEKMKSEISIYRQTLKELETENTEYVDDIEELQRKMDEEKIASEQRQVEHEKHLVELQEELLELKDISSKQKGHINDNEAMIKDLMDQNEKHERRYQQEHEEKEKLLEQAAQKRSNDEKAEESPSIRTVPGSVNAPVTATKAEVLSAPASPDNEKSATVSNPPRKKIKKIKKKPTLAQQLNDDVEQDVLQVAEAQISASSALTAPSSSEAQGSLVSPSLAGAGVDGDFAASRAEKERLQNENLKLKKSIEMLNEEVDKLREQIAPSSGGAVSLHSSSDTLQLRKDLEEALALADKLKVERDQAKMECKRVKVLNAGGSTEREQELERELEEVRAELEVVAAQLLPIKEKLSEYIAMADRIGIPYPFSAEYEQKLGRKMRSLKKHSERL